MTQDLSVPRARTTDEVVADYHRRVMEDGDTELAGSMAAAAELFPRKFYDSCGTRLLPRPMFVAESEMFGFVEDLTSLFDVLADLPATAFGGDVDAYCAAVGMDPRRAALVKRFPGKPPLCGRADLYHDGTSFKVLEFNVGSAMGGTDRAEISRLILEIPAFARFAREHGLEYVHTGRRIAETFRSVAAHLTDGAEPVVGFVESDGGLGTFLPLVESFQEMMTGLGIEVVLGEVGQVTERDDRLWLHGRPLDIVLRYFSENSIVDDPDGERAVEPIFRAHEEGRVVLWTPLDSSRINNKGSLALLGEPNVRAHLSADELALVDRVLPWTRALRPGEVSLEGGDRVDLVEYCLGNREELILKPSLNFGGAGIVVGWKVGDDEWATAVKDSLDQGVAVQRRVQPRREPVFDPATGTIQDWHAVWDAFLLPGGYAGSHIRAVPAEGGDPIIRMGAQGARTTGVFYHPDR